MEIMDRKYLWTLPPEPEPPEPPLWAHVAARALDMYHHWYLYDSLVVALMLTLSIVIWYVLWFTLRLWDDVSALVLPHLFGWLMV